MFLLLIAALIGSAGCAAVGPNYVKPEVPVSGQWHTQLKGGEQAAAIDSAALANWWETLKDPVLSDLISRSVSGNLDLKKAKSRIRQARASRRLARSGFFPTVTGSASATKSRGSKDTGGGTETELYSTGLDASWEIDIFGGVRRSVEAATGDLQASEEDLRDVLVSLMAEVGLNYVDVRTYQARLAVAEANLKTQEETLELTQTRSQAGLTNDLAVQQARYNLESTRSQIPTLRTGLEEAMNRLAVLTGQQPGAVHGMLEQSKPIPVPPIEVAVGVPADVLRQRPDVRRAERELAAQTARVGVATAELYPKLTLNGSIGLDAMSVGNLFLGSSRAFSFGPRLSIPVFNAGAIRSNIEVQSALQEQALIGYESSVLSALEEVENALVAYAQEQNRRDALVKSTDAARQAAALAEKQYQAGLVDFTSVLDAQRSLLSFEDQLEQSNGTVTSDLVRLYKTLGGGWSPLTPEVATTEGRPRS